MPVKTDELIDNLSETLAPVPRHAVLLRLAQGVGGGAIVSFLILWVSMGFRPDLAQAVGTSMYWMKFFYTLSLALFAFWATERLARPSSKAGWPLLGAAIVILALTFLSGMQMMHTPPAKRMPMLMGHSSHVCPWLIVGLSIPIFIGTFWALRALAPTRLTFAGAVAGILAGAVGTFIYAFHCNESAAPFVAIWYTLGIAAMGVLGAVLGRVLLRW